MLEAGHVHAVKRTVVLSVGGKHGAPSLYSPDVDLLMKNRALAMAHACVGALFLASLNKVLCVFLCI